MSHLFAQADAARLPLADGAVDLVFGSPPYRKARLYLEDGRDLGIARDTEDWIAWMLAVTTEALRVSRGAVVWVAAGSTEGRNYHPICEGLMYRWWQMGGHAYRPCYWHRVGIPGSGHNDWFRADVEYIMCFKRPGELPWAENTAMGTPPKFAAGGQMSNRMANGRRLNDWAGTSDTNRKVDGSREKRFRPCHAKYETEGLIANPGTLISTGAAGGGNIGHPIAHENEAPFPEALAEFFVRSLCPPRVCAACGTAVQSRHENTHMPAVRTGVPDIRVSNRPEQVLLEGVFEQGNGQAPGQVPVLRRSDSREEGDQSQSVLLETVLEPMDGQAPRSDETSSRDETGVRLAPLAPASPGHQGGVCDGASSSHGEAVGAALGEGRGRPPQERQEGRQQDREFGVDVQESARPFAQAKEPDRLPRMRSHDRQDEICVACGADLRAPGAVRQGIVCDPFSGSGTTVSVASQHGRRGIGFDLRRSQCELGTRRLTRPHAPVMKSRPNDAHLPLFKESAR